MNKKGTFGYGIGVILNINLLLLNYNLGAQQQTFGLDEKLGAYIPDSIFVLNEDSVLILLNDLITKPTLLSLGYYQCSALCPKLMGGIAELVNFSRAIPERDYQIVTISIYDEESPVHARQARECYTEKIHKDIDSNFWRFFTADSATIQKLTRAIGWEFRRNGNDLVHTASTLLITPKGMISQYFYGTYFNYMHFQMSVEKALHEEVLPVRVKKLKYCYNYIPEKNKKLSILVSFYGIMIVLAVSGLYARLALRKKSRKKI